MISTPKTYVVNLDKLILSFEIENDFYSSHLKLSNNFLYQLSENNEYNKDYKNSWIISDPNTKENLFYIDIENRFCNNYNRIRVLNKTLYNLNFQTLLNTLISSYNLINPIVKYIDICIDTTEPVLKRYNDNIQKGLLKSINKSYLFDYYGNENDRIKSGIENETKYIKKSNQKIKSRTMRVENKLKEIEDNKFKKQYILDSLKSKGLNISSRIERIELRLVSQCFKYLNRVYIHRQTNKEISVSKYKTLVDGERIYYFEKVKETYHNVSISLLSNVDYLLSLFNNYSLFNHSKLITLSTNKSFPIIEPIVKIRDIEKKIVNDNKQRELDEHLKEQQINFHKEKLKELEGENIYSFKDEFEDLFR